MSTYRLRDKIEMKDEKHSQYTIEVVFDNPEHVAEHTEKRTQPVAQYDENEKPVLDENGVHLLKDEEVEVTVPAVGFKQLVFEQDVILPDSDTEKAAQAYADDYEKQYNELHKEK